MIQIQINKLKNQNFIKIIKIRYKIYNSTKIKTKTKIKFIFINYKTKIKMNKNNNKYLDKFRFINKKISFKKC